MTDDRRGDYPSAVFRPPFSDPRNIRTISDAGWGRLKR
jgi:hypothetical protein